MWKNGNRVHSLTQLNVLDVTPPKWAHKYQSKRSRWPFRRKCFICCYPERKSPVYSMRRRAAGNPRTSPQHQMGSETHLMSMERYDSSGTFPQYLRLKWESKHFPKLNTTATHNNTTHWALCVTLTLKHQGQHACTLNVMFYSHLFLNMLFTMNIHKRYATLASSFICLWDKRPS